MSMAIQITDSMDALLDWFQEEPCNCATIGYIDDELNYSRETIRGNLKQLMAADCAVHVHEATALYHLTDDPRDD
jgi:hypothetical protein